MGADSRARPRSLRARAYSLFSDSSLIAANQISSELGLALKARERIDLKKDLLILGPYFVTLYLEKDNSVKDILLFSKTSFDWSNFLHTHHLKCYRFTTVPFSPS